MARVNSEEEFWERCVFRRSRQGALGVVGVELMAEVEAGREGPLVGEWRW